MGGKNGMPDRWADYSNMGRRINSTRFICFKVPLDQKYDRVGGNFSVRDLTDHCQGLGLVIDLTNTDRYYNKEDLIQRNVQYRKIYTKGHVIPSKSVVRQFFDAVNEFLEKNEDNDKLIGVHCTHGVNRTGYLVCRYMIQILDIAPDQAIADFESARGHTQERELYKADLRKALWMNEDPGLYKVDKNDMKRGGSNQQWRRNSGPGAYDMSSCRYDTSSNTYDTRDYCTYDDDVNAGTSGSHSYGREAGVMGPPAGDDPSQPPPPGCEDDYEPRTPQTPLNSSTNSYTSGSDERRPSRSSRRRSFRTPDGPEHWRVTDKNRDRSPLAGSSHDSTTPRGTKRHRDRSDSVASSRGPWLPPTVPFGGRDADDTSQPPRLRFKRAPSDSRYGSESQKSYDPYFYQQRHAGGPTRTDRYGGVLASSAGAVVAGGRAAASATRQYRGPKKYRSPPRNGIRDDDGATKGADTMGLEEHEPLSFPSDGPPEIGFLCSPPPVAAGPKRNPTSPCTQGGVFSPEATPGAGNKRRRSNRFEPY